MNRLLSCEFNIDTACVELRYADGEKINIYTPVIEDIFDTTPAMRSEMAWLICHSQIESDRRAVSGTLDACVRSTQGHHRGRDART